MQRYKEGEVFFISFSRNFSNEAAVSREASTFASPGVIPKGEPAV